MKKYILNYINSDNEESTREVSEILSKNFGYFDAFDSKYEEISTFRISRIKFLADKNSGEIIDNILEFITLNHGTDEVIREFHWQNRPRTLDEIRRIGKKQFF
jgi:predicted DNA-binding transcriptional regulator YafY